MKFILKFLFNFNMFSTTAWKHLMHAHLHGFGGFVFGILVLAALPLYVATTTIILRTKKPLLELPIPNTIKKAFAPPPPHPKEPTPTTTPATPEPDTETFPEDMPSELRGAFRRARRTGRHTQISAFDNSHILNVGQPIMAQTSHNAPPTQTATTTDTADDFPLPTDFDFSDTIDTDDASIPTFSEINFDNEPTTTPVQPTTRPEKSPSPILDKLPGAQTDGDLIIHKDMIIAVHDDPDFWIADDIDWFASGKQRPNPTIALKQRAEQTGLTPVLYLATTNILDIDARTEQWRKDGITVITDLTSFLS